MTTIKLAQFMATRVGRMARAFAGIALIAMGLSMNSAAGIALAALGIVSLAAGLLNVCFIAPLLRVPFRGTDACAR